MSRKWSSNSLKINIAKKNAKNANIKLYIPCAQQLHTLQLFILYNDFLLLLLANYYTDW